MRLFWVILVLAGFQLPSPALADCQVIRVVDGDTVHLSCGGLQRRVRVLGFDTPELSHPHCARERARAQQAAEVLRRLVTSGRLTVVAFQGRDRYGRDLARLSIAGRDVTKEMLASGLARPYAGGRHPDWCAGA